MSIKNIVVLNISKLIGWLSKLTGKGRGTAITGLSAERMSDSILEELVESIPKIILITGTNGKTTTQTFLASVLKESGKNFISNKSGANLSRGILSTLIKQTNWKGQLNFEYAIFELEEATIPKVAGILNPDIIIATNLFRDQLDAYGEIDRTQKFIKEAIKASPNATLILNADDPRVSVLSYGVKNKTIYYGLKEKDRSKFNYENQVSSEIKESDVERVDSIMVKDDLRTEIRHGGIDYILNPPGKFHAYNALATVLASKELGIADEIIQKGLENAQPAFGRGENINVDGLNYKFLLVKNPAGMNLTLDLLKSIKQPQLIFMLNDKIADGRDVSWIWDSHFELLEQIKPVQIICSGDRAEDMLLRIKYSLGELIQISANIYRTKSENTEIIIEKDIHKIHRLNMKSNNKQFFVLPTYTAMLKFRKYLLGNALNE